MRAPLVLALVLVAEAAAGKDLVLRQRAWGPGRPKPGEEQTEYFSGGKIVIASPRLRTIVDLKARTWTLIELQRKSYRVVTFDDLRRARDRTAAALKRLPPAERKALGADDAISLRPTGRTAEIAGHAAKEYAVSGGAASGSVWVSEEIAAPEEAREWDQLSTSLGDLPGPYAAFKAATATLKGVPLRTDVTLPMGPGKVESGTEVLEVREEAPPADLLAVPAGFTRVAPPGE